MFKSSRSAGINGRKGTVTEITWPFDFSVFEKLRFRPSTLHHLAGVFKFLHPGDRFRKAPFSVTENAVTENAVLVWTGRPNRRKKDAFSNLSGLVWTRSLIRQSLKFQLNLLFRWRRRLILLFKAPYVTSVFVTRSCRVGCNIRVVTPTVITVCGFHQLDA